MRKILISHPSALFIGIIGFEAIFSLMDLSMFPGVMPVTKVLGYIFPVINNFTFNSSVSSSVAPYIALTCALTPVKAFVAYFLVMQLSPRDKSLVVNFPSSNASLPRKVFSTFLVLILNAGIAWYVFNFGDSSYFNTDVSLNSAAAKYRLVSAGGIQMWLGWAVMHLTIMALLLGLLVAFVDEWFRFPFNFKYIDKE